MHLISRFVLQLGHITPLTGKNKLPANLQNFPPAFGGKGTKSNGVRNPEYPPNTGKPSPQSNPNFQPARGPPHGGPPQRELSQGPGMGGVAVLPPGANSDQQMRRTKDSPGYGDLGIRHFGGSNPGIDHNVSLDMDTGPVYAAPNKTPGYDNKVYRPSPGSQRQQMSAQPGHDSVV